VNLLQFLVSEMKLNSSGALRRARNSCESVDAKIASTTHANQSLNNKCTVFSCLAGTSATGVANGAALLLRHDTVEILVAQ
jgi:hypothetical protein